MRTYKLFAIAFFLILSIPSFAQKTVTDSTYQAIKVKELQMRKQAIEKQIKQEDAKRDQTLTGVSAESQELINDKQDSICLDLRSQLVSVELELKELVPNKTVTTVIDQLNVLNQNNQNSNQSNSQKYIPKNRIKNNFIQ